MPILLTVIQWLLAAGLGLGLVALVLWLISRVPQGENWVIERFGVFDRVVKPGIHLIIPFAEVIAYRMNVKDTVIYVPRHEIITLDRVTLHANGAACIRIKDVAKAAYEISNFQQGVTYLIQTTLNSIVSELNLDEALSSRRQIKNRLRSQITDELRDWGVTLKRIDLLEFLPNKPMRKAMETQATETRNRKALMTRTEALRQAAIIEAETQRETSLRHIESVAEQVRRFAELMSEFATDNEQSKQLIPSEYFVDLLKQMGLAKDNKSLVAMVELHDAKRRKQNPSLQLGSTKENPDQEQPQHGEDNDWDKVTSFMPAWNLDEQEDDSALSDRNEDPSITRKS